MNVWVVHTYTCCTVGNILPWVWIRVTCMTPVTPYSNPERCSGKQNTAGTEMKFQKRGNSPPDQHSHEVTGNHSLRAPE